MRPNLEYGHAYLLKNNNNFAEDIGVVHNISKDIIELELINGGCPIRMDYTANDYNLLFDNISLADYGSVSVLLNKWYDQSIKKSEDKNLSLVERAINHRSRYVLENVLSNVEYWINFPGLGMLGDYEQYKLSVALKAELETPKTGIYAVIAIYNSEIDYAGFVKIKPAISADTLEDLLLEIVPEGFGDARKTMNNDMFGPMALTEYNVFEIPKTFVDKCPITMNLNISTYPFKKK